ncbi:MAG: IS110 family transposase [Cyanobacteria bacterium P01_F01_bin.143]
MVKSRKKKSAKKSEASQLQKLNPHTAGIDLGAREHWVCVPSEASEQNIRCFGCTTPDLLALADWLEECHVTSVALESTGVEWIPLFQILSERNLEVFLVNAKMVKNVPGRKSDVLDCQWLQQLHSYGLLAPSFVPKGEIAVLRSYLRQRENLIKNASSHIQRMQKALTQMNLQLHKVISDITGVTGLNIIRAIISGERNPQTLAKLADRRIKSSPQQLEAALTGNYREEMVFILHQELSLYEFYQRQIALIEEKIEQCLGQFPSLGEEVPTVAKKKASCRGKNPSFDLRSHLYRITGVDFTTIDGLDVLTVQTIISEVGLDPNKFKTVKHFASWLGLCPGCRITGGRVKSSQTRKVVNRAAKAFRLAAQAVSRSNSALGAFYRRIAARTSAAKAITATAHKIARLFYTLWKSKQSYQDQGADYYEQRYRQRVIKHLSKKAQDFGFQLVEANSV